MRQEARAYTAQPDSRGGPERRQTLCLSISLKSKEVGVDK